MTTRPRTLKRRLAVLSKPVRHRLAGILGLNRGPSLPDPFAAQTSIVWPAYEAWLSVNRRTDAGRRELAAALAAYDSLPTISVILPVHNGDPDYLRQAIRSVMDQEYQHWQLCIADDASERLGLRELIAASAVSDSRIVFVNLSSNLGISGATNAAAALAEGSILAFLDQDDLLAPEALGEVALQYLAAPKTDLAYSDDDKIDGDNRRTDPQFKPDWSPTLLLSFMYPGHLLSVRRVLFEDLGGFRSAFDGAQDYDFALRAQERARHVGHIPRVLYHWRAAPGSTALDGEAKPHAIEAGRKAVFEAMKRRGVPLKSVTRPPWAASNRLGLYRLTFEDTGPSVDLVLVVTAAEREQAWCRLVKDTSYDRLSVRIVSSDWAKPGALGSRIEAALSDTHGQYVAVVDAELEPLDPHWLSQLVGYTSLDKVAVSAATILDRQGRIVGGALSRSPVGTSQVVFSDMNANSGGYMGLNACAREVAATQSGCWVARRSAFDQIRPLNSKWGLADIEWALAEGAQTAGEGVLTVPGVQMTTSSRARSNRSQALMQFDPFTPSAVETGSYDLRAVSPPPRQALSAIKVAFVFHNLDFEGASITLADVLIGLVMSGHTSAAVFAPSDGPLRERLEQVGATVAILPALHMTGDPGDCDSACRALRNALSPSGVSVVVANTIRMFAAITTAAQLGLPSILYQHESEDPARYFDYLNEQTREIAYRAFSLAYSVVYVAEATRNTWRALETRRNFRVIRNALPPTLAQSIVCRDEARLSLALNSSLNIVLTVGSLCRRKRQLDIVKAFGALPSERRKDALLILVGDFAESEYVNDIRSAIKDLGISHQTVLTGLVEDTVGYFAAADLYICASEMESAPRVLLQALAAALPIITTPVFGIPEIVGTGPHAMYFEVGDIEALVSAMTTGLTRGPRQDERHQSSRARFDKLPTHQAMIAKFHELICEASVSSVPRSSPGGWGGATKRRPGKADSPKTESNRRILADQSKRGSLTGPP